MPLDVAADELDLAGVQSRAYLEPEAVHRIADRARAPDRARRAVERREEAVADDPDLMTAKRSSGARTSAWCSV